MALTLYFHPFSSYCQKVLIALYEGGIAFEPRLIDLGDAESRAELEALWPLAKFPVLGDARAGVTLPESSIIIEYLDRYQPDGARMLPADPDAALEARLWDRFFDQQVSTPLQTIVAEHIAGTRDPRIIGKAQAMLDTAYAVLDERLGARTWAAGEAFGLADCAAAPALYYARLVRPFGERRALDGYLRRLLDRPSFARAVEEARYFRPFFPVGGAEADWLDP